MLMRPFNIAVFAFWLAATSWLVVTKVLPPLVVGEPPSYRTIVKAQSGPAGDEPSLWRLYWNERAVGWAWTQTTTRPGELTEIESRVHISDLPLNEIMPFRVGAVVKMLQRPNDKLTLDAESIVSIDPLGRLEEFQSAVRLGMLDDVIRTSGRVEDNKLDLHLSCGDFVHSTKLTLSADALVGDVFSPQPLLPNLRINQTWTVPVYSPFRMPNSPMQVLTAKVERNETIVWNGRAVKTWLVVYQGDEGAGLARTRQSMGRLWVRADGRVLKQEFRMSSAVLQFVREAYANPDLMPPTHGLTLVQPAGDDEASSTD